jgi:hypothetical protein
MNIIQRIEKSNADLLKDYMQNSELIEKNHCNLYLNSKDQKIIFKFPEKKKINIVFLWYKFSNNTYDLVFYKIYDHDKYAKTIKFFEDLEAEEIGFLFENTLNFPFPLWKVEYLKLLKLLKPV